MKNETKQENNKEHDFETNQLGLGTCKNCGTYRTNPQFPAFCHTEVKEDKWKEDAKNSNSFSVNDQANIYSSPPISQREECNHWTCRGCKDCGGWAENPDIEQACFDRYCKCHSDCSCVKCDGECHFQEPYGFVPHAGCPLHDKMSEEERKAYTPPLEE